MADKKKEVKVEVEVEVEPSENYENAQKVVNKYSMGAAGLSIVTLPGLELGLLGALQLKMVHSLTKRYGQKFSANAVRGIIGSLAGMVAVSHLKSSTLARFLRAVPVVGFIGSYSVTIYNAALTYAIGKVFIHHFEAGGTVLTLNAKKIKGVFEKYFKEGKAAAEAGKLDPEAA